MTATSESRLLISVVIPFHNEEDSLAELLPELQSVLSEAGVDAEVLLVDDASTDRSASIVSEIIEGDDRFRLLTMSGRGGQTGCFKLAFAAAGGEYILRMDADLQDDPRDIPLFLQKIDAGADLIMGLREARKHTRVLRIASALFDLVILTLFNSPLHSNTGSFVAFRAEVVKDLPWYKNDHRYLPLIAMYRGATRVREVFVRHRARKYGRSKYGRYRKIVLGIPEVIWFLIRLRLGRYRQRPACEDTFNPVSGRLSTDRMHQQAEPLPTASGAEAFENREAM
jgi:glycosyltransferase involved in cell wall biosynthesis